ncbi:N-acetylmuramoyl-L-alanine amidase [Exercitatus varius]|uniref:N-acetylmuramoyl-L-alanine amidase n=1 Tax=Exercitatus varius TaxID=67857 RepID=UPI00294B84BA|nr:N-acetylmuramoyl-L-alanine amidase [Exercitatus varius]MDG2962734.1 N-acetylmuramoyl-L-alanine amidase [Exercitatus varius]
MKILAILSAALYASSAVAFSVILDTGHTEKHYGAVSPFNKTEFSYNQAMVTTLQRHILARKLDVELVPNTQPDLTLQHRTLYGNKTDLFVSIHHDSFPPELNAQRENLSGFSVFVSQKNPNYPQSLNCARAVATRLIQAGERRSRYHESDIEGERKTLLDERGVYRYDELAVLKNARSPAILIEIGVIANPSEAKRLERTAVKEQIAKAISLGIADCIKTH